MARIHPITRFRREQDPVPTIKAFASLLGIDRTTLSNLENGHRDHLSPEINKKVEAITKGAITAAELDAWTWSESTLKQLKKDRSAARKAFAGVAPAPKQTPQKKGRAA